MSDSLRPAALLVDRLGDRLDVVLPESEPAIDGNRLAATSIELRQVAGLAAGRSMALGQGSWEFGPDERSDGLGAGDPDRIGFTLTLDDDLVASIAPGDHPVRLDDEPVVGPTEVAGRMINAGSARFVVARPRPARRRSGGEIPPGQIDPWVTAPLPSTPPAPVPGVDPGRLAALRWRCHAGADGLVHRIESGRSHLWHRDRQHPLFGTAMVGVADLPGAVPIAIDALGANTVLTGCRSHQLAVARHIVLGLAATIHPADLRLGLQSELPDLAFIRDLPHAAASTPPRRSERPPTLLVVDGATNRPMPVLADGGALLVLGQAGSLAPRQATWLGVVDPCSLSIETRQHRRTPRGITPVGFGASLAADLAAELSAVDVDSRS